MTEAIPGPRALSLTCEQVEELAAAYALDALPADEEGAIAEHLATCANPHSSLTELAELASMLAFLVPAAQPPADLGARIVAQASAEPVVSEVASPRLDTALDGVATAPLRFPALQSRRWWIVTVGQAAALVAITIGLSIWGFSQHQALQRERLASAQQAAVLTALASGGATIRTQPARGLAPAVLIQPQDGSSAYLIVNWAPAPSGKSYQAWLIGQGQKPVSAAVFDGSAAGIQIVRLAEPLPGAAAFAVTLEPSGGSAQPTSQPFLVQNLTS